jgi:hypothetical protein
MILWSVAWIGPIVTIVNLILGGYFPVSLILLAAILQGCYASVYMIGLWHNLQDVNINKIKALALYISTFVLLPVVNLIEGLSVIYGITRPVKSFEIVNKN